MAVPVQALTDVERALKPRLCDLLLANRDKPVDESTPAKRLRDPRTKLTMHHLAACEGAHHGTVTRLLLAITPYVDGHPSEGVGLHGAYTSPLGVAAEQGSTDCCRALLEAGVEVRCVNDAPPAYFASVNGQRTAYELLVKAGADVEPFVSIAYKCVVVP